MNTRTERRSLAGPTGALECAIDRPEARAGAARGLALICHPHPLHGGTLDNKVVQTLARAAVGQGLVSVRLNFRGVGASAGSFDAGEGETDDAQAVLDVLWAELFAGPGPAAGAAAQSADTPAAAPAAEAALVLAGFSFGAFVAARLAAALPPAQAAALRQLVLVGPAVSRFEVPAAQAPTLVVHGETDEVVPLAAVLDWARPQALPVVVVPGSGHFFHGQLPLLKRLVGQALSLALAPTD